DNKRMKEYEDAWPAPKVYQSFKSIESVPLQKVNEEYASYLADRTSSDPMKDLSLIFDFCFGERFRLDHAYDEQNFLQLECLRKAIPSGGGRHPTELFFVVFDESLGLAQGLYHYNVQQNALDLLRRGDHFNELQSSLAVPLKSNNGERPEAMLLFTSLCERAMWRYRDPRSWRAFIIDVGHAEYMCRQVCASLGYSLPACHRFDAAAGAAFLGLDHFRQPLLSVAALEKNR
ncbi:MAG: SagB family peptide dehydrogenase, partial [Candidatus Obscuribacterales bacterium]|nr:SagB family peptide dehydrogenase [Candidatus Obscuribacterales bacterium]